MHGIRAVLRSPLHAVDGQPLTFFVEATILVSALIMIVMVIVPAPVTATVYGGHGTKRAGTGAYRLVGRAVMPAIGVKRL